MGSWVHGETDEALPGSAGAGSATGVGAERATRVGAGQDRVDRRQYRLFGGGSAPLAAALPGRPRPARGGSTSEGKAASRPWSGSCTSCAGPTGCCANRRVFPPMRNSTVARNHDGLHRRPPQRPRGRAHLQAAADGPVELLGPTAIARAAAAEGRARFPAPAPLWTPARPWRGPAMRPWCWARSVLAVIRPAVGTVPLQRSVVCTLTAAHPSRCAADLVRGSRRSHF